VKTAEVREIVYDNVQLPLVLHAYHMPAQGTPDFYALRMLGTLLTGGESSRMTKEIKDKQQKAVQIMSIPFPLEDPGLFIAFGLCNVGVKPEDLESSIDAEVLKVKNDLITETEFQKIKNQVETEYVTRNSTVQGIGESLANYFIYFGDANLINTELQRYMKVTREDIKSVANKYLTKENRVVLYYLPKAMEKK
jgi:predicted Zn-dependent peptidase